MRTPRSALALLGLGLLVGCGVGNQSSADKQQACADVAAVVAPLQLAATPNEKDTAEVANNLDPKLSSLRDVSAHDAAVRLHQQLHAYETALRTQREGADALDRARSALTDLAKACGMPESTFLTPSPAP